MLARTNKHLGFDELLEYLQEEVIQLEHIRKIEQRLNRLHIFETNANNTLLTNICPNTDNDTNLNSQTTQNGFGNHVEFNNNSRLRCDTINSSINHSGVNNF